MAIASAEPTAGLRFSQVYRDDSVVGITTETREAQDTLNQQFQEWLEFKSDKIPKERKVAWIELCRKASISSSSPFCLFFLKESNKISGQLSTLSDTPSPQKLSRSQVFKLWHSHQWGPLSGLSENEIQPILRTLGSPQASFKLAEALLKHSQCLPSALFVGVGLKLETAFPKSDYRQRVEQLYQRASACGKDRAAILAGYRLGLFKIWDNQFPEAEKILSQVPDSLEAPDYRMRVAYWRYYCAEKMKNEPIQGQMREWLTREYPLSLHALLVHPSKLGSSLAWKEWEDPTVLFRPLEDPDLASMTGAIEYLLLHKEKQLASMLLHSYEKSALKANPNFRLYWAILLKRAGHYSESFRIMASAFRNSPHLISRSTLEILYPRDFLELIPDNSPVFRPYFALSIIRQESAFDPAAKSGAKAYGLMQLQIPTARSFKRRISQKELMEPETNIQIGVKYFTELFNRQHQSVELALASYNAGPGRIQQWKKRYPIEERLLFIDLLPAKETRDYVSSILRNYFWYLQLYTPDPVSRNLAGQSLNIIQSIIPFRQNF
jgi:soluble lytic murein transglycosylase